MKTTRLLYITICMLISAALTAGNAFASGQRRETEPTGTQAPYAVAPLEERQIPYETMMRGSQLLGRSVVRAGSDQRIGEVRDLVMDLNDGYVPYLMMSFQNVSGLDRDDLIPVPLYLVAEVTERGELRLMIEDMDTLRFASPLEEYDAYQGEGLGWTRRMYTYWQNVNSGGAAQGERADAGAPGLPVPLHHRASFRSFDGGAPVHASRRAGGGAGRE